MTKPLYRIGELAALSGVPVKTIRYYSDLGLLPPAAVRGSGYRMYADADRARLAVIRALRDIGVNLATIARLLTERTGAAETLALQLDAVDVGIRVLQRRRAVLRHAVRLASDGDGTGALAYLERLHALAAFDALERQRLLDDYLDRTFAGIPVGAHFEVMLRDLVTLDVPGALTDLQLDAWLELATLVGDERFLARLRALGTETWGPSGRPAMDDAWHAEQRAVQHEALRHADAGADVAGADAGALVGRYVALAARGEAATPDAAFAAALLARIDRHADPRAERFWVLVGILKGWERPTDLPTSRAYRWLFAALRARVALCADVPK